MRNLWLIQPRASTEDLTCAEKSEKLTVEMTQLRISLSDTAKLKTDFNASELRSGKILITAQDINFAYQEAPL